VEANLRLDDWHKRDAAVSAFGAIMEGPDEKVLDPIVKQALPVLIDMMSDKVLHVQDSAAYALGRICEACSEAIDPQIHLPPLISSLFTGLANNPKMAASCCWALMNLAERFSGDIGAQQNPLTTHFNESVTRLLQVTERPDADNQLRTAAYEVLNSFVMNSASDSLPAVASLSDVIIKRLEGTIPLQAQVVSVEDRITLEEMQTSLCSVLLAIVQRLEKEIAPQADIIMSVLLQILSSVGAKSSVPDAIFATVGSLANALEEGFAKYMEAFSPFLYNALANQEEPALCAMAIGLVSDITRSMGAECLPYCDTFMNYLLNNLRVDTHFHYGFIISCAMLILIYRVPLLQINSNLLFSSALEILQELLVEASRNTSLLLRKSYNKLPVYKLVPMVHTRCSTMSSLFVRVSWMHGVASLVL
jgi:importin subunit beta-1